MAFTNLFLGIDGGGTKTKAVLINTDQKIIGSGEAAGSNANIFGQKAAVDQVWLAAKQALDNHKGNILGCIAIAGIDTKDSKKAWAAVIVRHQKLSKIFAKPPLIVNDITAAVRSGTTDKNAVAVIAGTGSSCWGYNEKGEEAKAGGADYILADEGSGYDIGLKILKSVAQAADGRGPKTLLTELLFNQLKIDSLEDLHKTVYKKPWNKTDIAQVAPLAEAAAEKQDQVAAAILEQAAHDLGVMIKAVVKKLSLQNKPYIIVTSGSVFKIQKILCEKLEEAIFEFSPLARFVKPKIDSATAAAYLAMETT